MLFFLNIEVKVKYAHYIPNNCIIIYDIKNNYLSTKVWHLNNKKNKNILYMYHNKTIKFKIHTYKL